MTGFRTGAFRWLCSRDGCYNDNLPSWDWMMGAFPRSIRPTDIDGMVEVNGRFLFIEQKRAGAQIPHGQSLALKRLTAASPLVTVLILWETDDDDKLKCMAIQDGCEGTLTVMTKLEIARRMGTWARQEAAA